MYQVDMIAAEDEVIWSGEMEVLPTIGHTVCIEKKGMHTVDDVVWRMDLISKRVQFIDLYLSAFVEIG